LGAFIQGISVDGRTYSGGWYDWLTPFSIFTGLALIAGYALLGATWLIMKTEGELQAASRKIARPLLWIVVGAVALVSLWTPLLNDVIAARWFSWPNMAYRSPVPLLVTLVTVGIDRALKTRREKTPFILALFSFVLSYLGLGISLVPLIVPPRIDIWQAAAPDESLGFLLIGTSFLLPLMLGYTVYVYWVFRGKTETGAGYH